MVPRKLLSVCLASKSACPHLDEVYEAFRHGSWLLLSLPQHHSIVDTLAEHVIAIVAYTVDISLMDLRQFATHVTQVVRLTEYYGITIAWQTLCPRSTPWRS